MSPPLVPGWSVLTNNMAYWAEDPTPGQVARVRRPFGWALRRIAAMPGQRVEIRDGRLLVDGAPGRDDYGPGDDRPPVVLGPDEYYVLADDRAFPDSREWGPVPRRDVVGQAVFQIDPSGEFHAVPVFPSGSPAATPSPAAAGPGMTGEATSAATGRAQVDPSPASAGEATSAATGAATGRARAGRPAGSPGAATPTAPVTPAAVRTGTP